MLSYQHHYDAANLTAFATRLAGIGVGNLTHKDTPLSYLQTHVGRALYDLSAEEAIKIGEAVVGSSRVLTTDPFAKSGA